MKKYLFWSGFIFISIIGFLTYVPFLLIYFLLKDVFVGTAIRFWGFVDFWIVWSKRIKIAYSKNKEDGVIEEIDKLEKEIEEDYYDKS